MSSDMQVAPKFLSMLFFVGASLGLSSRAEVDAEKQTGVELTLCEDCPVFVRVPDAPASLRPIRYVSKFELTWNNYLAAYDDGACEIPNPNAAPQTAGPNDILPHLDKYRIDWPVEQLGVADVQCYIDWLEGKTGYDVALPTAREWEWFARAGRKGAKFPWGNEPDARREALGRTEVPERSRTPWPFEEGGREINRHLSGVKVGLFPPNDWGLHDLMGNVRELTSDTISGEEFLRRNPDSRLAQYTRNKGHAVLKGSEWWVDPAWAAEGIDAERYAIIFGNRYSTGVGIRLILTERRAGSD
ncbi:formylglycine-generating enzyme family protein [Sphingosinicella sp. LY1275]|uniref:formylglycine-generating enzyme family protein n=1 Tax=Sphingosinicella sp. LY1275 TaxID=3095379 RepID=UPI002ADECC87|nr:SUMF1/EgtB/PvdO family nonheme iron enzyme [Sphingosinicella sp. LY1275]MEA1013287.1 SUMF1/EgtB/PvdO family nonheme iron enzyme [Sphingosinicella sp. LY1275]